MHGHYKDRMLRRCFESVALSVKNTLTLRQFLRKKALRRERELLLFWRDDAVCTVQVGG